MSAPDSTPSQSSIAALCGRYLRGETTPLAELDTALAHSNANANHNTYLVQNAAWSHAEAEHLSPRTIAAQPLWGIPVSLKDCFDLEGFRTSCGSSFYNDEHGIAAHDSAVATRLRAAGAVLTGKTHLHQLAYGITGENHDFGDCLQPRDARLLCGGSSSGAAASVQERSALAAIGTDTGGSIRTPAALCGLSGFRSSITLNSEALWRGGAHLAQSFDTLGWLYRSLAAGPLLGHALTQSGDLGVAEGSDPGEAFGDGGLKVLEVAAVEGGGLAGLDGSEDLQRIVPEGGVEVGDVCTLRGEARLPVFQRGEHVGFAVVQKGGVGDAEPE